MDRYTGRRDIPRVLLKTAKTSYNQSTWNFYLFFVLDEEAVSCSNGHTALTISFEMGDSRFGLSK